MSAVTSIFAVFTEVLNWFIESLESVTTIFYGAEGLTFIGGITVISVAIAVVLMVVAMVRSLLRFRG